jgi:arylsulfatase A-like enzyme/Flp pilus assembly protein TadD
MDRLAAAGLRFTRAHAHNVITLPSHANILSGRLPPDHGVRDNAGFRFPSDKDTLATILKARGYRTGAFVSAFPLDSRFGLARGFDEYDDRFTDAARPAFLIQERAGAETAARARTWIDRQQDAPWFCWLHIYEPHYPYAPPEPFASKSPGAPYQGDVSAADAALQAVIDPILSAGRDGGTLVVLTSDHGESLGDHGEATHGVFAYEAALSVPLVVYQPRLFTPKVIETPARHVDLLPTILETLALQSPPGLAGRSLLPDMTGSGERSGERPTYFEALSAALNRGWAPLAGVILGDVKYIDLPIPELYDLNADPKEQTNLAAVQPERLAAARGRLDDLRAGASAAPATETAETRERLRSLGYLTGGPGPAKDRLTEADDPKHLIAYDTRLQEIVALYLDGRLDDAIARCRALVAERPDMALALLHLAHLERERGNLPDAIASLRKAVALVPGNTENIAILGAYLTQAGRAEEAVTLLAPLARREDADMDVLTARALALANLGRTNDALSELTRARRQDPSNARLLLETGTIHMMAGNHGAAGDAWQAALDVNPNVARVHTSLGALALEEGRPAEAVGRFRSATRLDPVEFRTILALGTSFAEAGRRAEARAALEFFAANAPPSRFSAELGRARAGLAALR